MRLIKSKETPAKHGLPASHREWWEISVYQASVELDEEVCVLSIYSTHHDITFEIAGMLGVDTSTEYSPFQVEGNPNELFLKRGIGGLSICYTKPENYKELLKKIEKIIDTHFR